MTKSIAAHAASTPSRLIRLLVAAVAAGAVAAAASPALADTLVYVKNGTVYLSQPDGTGARAITTGDNGWAWPSETDAGIIAVAGGLSRINGSFNPSGSDQIYEFDQQGKQIAGPVATEGTYSTVNDPEYVSHFRVAPDNSNVAWTDIPSYTSPLTAWRNPNGSGTFSTASDCCGPLPYSNPEWWGSGHLLITHDGTTMGSQPEYTMYNLSDGSNLGWSADAAIGSASSYQVAVSRSGLVYAVMTDDGPDYGGTIHNIAITLETTSTPPTNPSGMTDTHCTITLPASQFATNHGSSLASMSFSSDGATLAWAQDDGIYEANVANPNDCATVTSSAHLVVPGGQMPFLGAAPLSPATSQNPQNPQPSCCTPPPPPCCTPVPPPAKMPDTRITKISVNTRSHSVTVRFRGAGSGRLRYQCRLGRGRWKACSSPWTVKHMRRGRYVIAVRAIDGSRRFDPTPATKTVKVGR